MKKVIIVVMGIFLLAIAATYYPWQKTEVVVETESISELDNSLKISDSSHIKYPVPEVPVKSTEEIKMDTSSTISTEELIVPDIVVEQVFEPLPELNESDGEISEAINSLADERTMLDLFLFKSFIRHFVVTIDNLPNKKIPQRYVFTQHVPDKFSVIRQSKDIILLDSKNFERYSRFVDLAERIDSQKLASVYIEFYPLFQEAYELLGYPDRYFNDRFIEVIDHLLLTPEIEGSISLIRPKVFYQFAKQELESLSAGQKILVRIGIDNTLRVKAKLRELRSILTKPVLQ